MPASKEVHCLAVMRRILRLKQSELAALAECSIATIQSIELNRLKLSKGLAARISLATGVNLDWLLENDINQPMPPLEPVHAGDDGAMSVDACRLFVLQFLFDWLFAIACRQPRSHVRTLLEYQIGWQLDYLKKSEGKGELKSEVTTNVFEFFAENPDLLDADLKKIINFDYLIQDQRRIQKQDKKRSREFKRRLRTLKAKPANQLSAEERTFLSDAKVVLEALNKMNNVQPGELVLATNSQPSGQIRQQQQEPAKESPKARKAHSQTRQSA
jgi:transcriptional regulator with XRE-family HTH domain